MLSRLKLHHLPLAHFLLLAVLQIGGIGWDNPVRESRTQKFTRESKTLLYTITIHLNGDKEYKFGSVNGSWDTTKLVSIKTEQASGDPSTLSSDLYPNGGNGRAP